MKSIIDKLPYDRRTKSGVIFRKPCLLFGVLLEPDGSNASYVDIYDGENTNEPKFLRFRTPATAPIPCIFSIPVYLERGLYLELETNLVSVTVLAAPAR